MQCGEGLFARLGLHRWHAWVAIPPAPLPAVILSVLETARGWLMSVHWESRAASSAKCVRSSTHPLPCHLTTKLQHHPSLHPIHPTRQAASDRGQHHKRRHSIRRAQRPLHAVHPGGARGVAGGLLRRRGDRRRCGAVAFIMRQMMAPWLLHSGAQGCLYSYADR